MRKYRFFKLSLDILNLSIIKNLVKFQNYKESKKKRDKELKKRDRNKFNSRDRNKQKLKGRKRSKNRRKKESGLQPQNNKD